MSDDNEPLAFDCNHETIRVGNVFFYRGAGSESATVYKVIVRSVDKKIVGLALVDIFEDGSEDARPHPNLYVHAERLEIVQCCGPLKERPPEPPPSPSLPKQMLKAMKKRRN